MHDQWLSVGEVAEHHWGSKNSIYTWVSWKGMPRHSLGHFGKFKKDELGDWIWAGTTVLSNGIARERE